MSRTRAAVVQIAILATGAIAIGNAIWAHRLCETVYTHGVMVGSDDRNLRGSILGQKQGVLLIVQDERRLLVQIEIMSYDEEAVVRLSAPGRDSGVETVSVEIPVDLAIQALDRWVASVTQRSHGPAGGVEGGS